MSSEKINVAIAKKINADLGNKIRALRGSKTQKTFSRELDVAPTRLSTWEKGHMPPNDKLVLLGNIATGETRLFFWEKAGLDTSKIEETVRSRFLAQRAKSFPDEAVLLKVCDQAGESSRSIAYPAARVPHLEHTFCLELENNFLPGLLRKGDLAVIDGSRNSILCERAGMLAVRFDPLPNLQPIHRSARRGKTVIPYGISTVTDPMAAQLSYEMEQRYLNSRRVGVRFGWVRWMYAGENEVWADNTDRPWCYVLEPATVKAVSENGIPLELMKWRQGNAPTSEAELKKCLLKGIEILGTVIGWIGAPGVESKPPDRTGKQKVKV